MESLVCFEPEPDFHPEDLEDFPLSFAAEGLFFLQILYPAHFSDPLAIVYPTFSPVIICLPSSKSFIKLA